MSLKLAREALMTIITVTTTNLLNLKIMRPQMFSTIISTITNSAIILLKRIIINMTPIIMKKK
jgi:hypothetical protein